MAKYAFILGHRPLLSVAELTAHFANRKISWRPQRFGQNVLVAEFDKEIKEPQELLNALGGTIKIAEIVTDDPVTLTTARENLQKSLTLEALMDFFVQTEKKVFFGFSLYPLADISPKDLQMFLRTYGVDMKRELRDKKISSRFVVGQDAALSSVIVAKNKLLSRGAEIDIIFDKQYLAIAKTLAVQDFEDYNLRDYGRPESDPKKGMLPPKVAQILLNLARLSPGKTVLDPFCGVGTILQEALLKDLTVMGTDIDPDMIRASRKNLDWLIETYGLEADSVNKLEVVDAKFLSKHIKSGSIDAVVTEGTLGPPLTRQPSEIMLERTTKKLTMIYTDALKAAHKVLAPRGRAVLTLPYYILDSGRRFMPLLDNMSKLGYTQTEPFSEEMQEKLKVKPTERGTLLYERPRQIVGREVLALRKK